MLIRVLPFLGVFLILSVTISGLLQPYQVSAHGEIRVIVNDVEEGPYLFRVGISPVSPGLGNLHINVLIQPADGDLPITDGQMIVTATGPEHGITAGPIQAVNDPNTPQVFEADIELTAIGNWTLMFETESSLGLATLILPLEVKEAGEGINPLVWIVIAVIVVAVGAIGWSQLQKNKQPA